MSPQKRRRILKNCSNCRKRRVKCDRARPICGSCVKGDRASHCHYDDELPFAGISFLDMGASQQKTEFPYEASARNPVPLDIGVNELHRHDLYHTELKGFDPLKSQITQLTEEVRNLKQLILSKNGLDSSITAPAGNSVYDTKFVDFYASYSPIHVRPSRVMYHGPISHFAILAKDKFLGLAWQLKRQVRSVSKPDKKKKVPSSDRALSEIVPLSLSVEKLKSNIKERIQMTLPPRRVIWLLLGVFFERLYPFFPYVDRDDFVRHITNIIGPEIYTDEPVFVRLEKRLDFAYVGILLVALRMLYLSKCSNKTSDEMDPLNREVDDYLVSKPLTHKLTMIAQLCLNQFRILRKADMLTFQLALYIRLYDRTSPEYDGNVDTFDLQTFTGLIFNMAFAIGLNLDPSSQFTEREVHLRRKLWYALKELDLQESVSSGIQMRLKDTDSNVKLPGFLDEKVGSFNEIMENRIVNRIRNSFKESQLSRQLISMVLGFAPVSLLLFTSKVSEFENRVSRNFKTLSEVITSEKLVDDVSRCLLIRDYLDDRALLIRLYYHLMLFHEDLGDFESARPYLIKMLELSVDLIANFDSRPAYSRFLSCGAQFLFHCSQFADTVVNVVISGLYFRCDRLSLDICDQDISKFHLLEEIKSEIRKNTQILCFAESRYSKSNYISWRLLQGLLGSIKLFDSAYFVKREGIVNFTIPDILASIPSENLLVDCSEVFLKKIKFLLTRDLHRSLLINKIEDFNVGLSHNPKFFDDLVAEDTWSRYRQDKDGAQFFANFSNHNINTRELDDDINDIFNDLIDF